MSDTPSPERTYKHQVPAEDFVEAFTTIEWTPEQTEKFNALGIERLRGIELRNSSVNLDYWHFEDSEEFTVLNNAKVIGDIAMNELADDIPHWYIYQCKLPTISLRNNSRKAINNSASKPLMVRTNIYVWGSNIANVDISNCLIGVLNLIKNKITGHFHIQKTTIENCLVSDSVNQAFRIFDDSVVEKLTVNTCTIDDFQISKSIVKSLGISEKSTVESLKISRNSFIGELNIEESAVKFSVIENSVLRDFDIETCQIIDFKLACNTIDVLYIRNSKLQSLMFEKVFTALTLDYVTINNCMLENCFLLDLAVENNCSIELYIYDGFINFIDFTQLTLGRNSVISFSETSIYTCEAFEFTMLGYLFFRRIRRKENVFESLNTVLSLHKEILPDRDKTETERYQLITETLDEQYKEYKNKSAVLHKAFKKPTFRISHSSLGKTEFTECDLGAFNFEYNNSKITEVFISGGTLPREVNVYGETDKLKDLEQQKSFFDQLKKVFEGQGDVVRGTKYHALASEKQMEIIEAEKGMWSSEWWVYWLNKKSNKHGESWWQAVKFIVYVSVPIYCCYCFSTPQFSFQGNWDWKLFGDFFGYYFSFLLPTHKVDFIPDVKQNVGTLFFDFFGRIATGYGIYQLISAFRKHGKKA